MQSRHQHLLSRKRRCTVTGGSLLSRVSRLSGRLQMSAAGKEHHSGTLKDTNIIKTHFLLQILALFALYDPVWVILSVDSILIVVTYQSVANKMSQSRKEFPSRGPTAKVLGYYLSRT